MDRNDPPPVDRLSSLSDSLLHSIIALLNLHGQVRTSVLSRRWRGLWCTNPVLKFNIYPFGHPPRHSPTISEAIVGHCLQQCADNMHLSLLEFRSSGKFVVHENWIGFAASRTVDALVIRCSELFDIIGGNSMLPLSIYRCCSLKSLEIRHAGLPEPSCFIDSTGWDFNLFPLLKSLSLRSVDGIGLSYLLSYCNQLESLELWEFSFTMENYISASKLSRLIIESFSSTGYLIIQGFKELNSLQLYRDLEELEISEETGEQLDTVTLFSSSDFMDFSEWLCFLRNFKNVKDLSVNRWFVQFMMEDDSDQADECPMFGNLKVFHYCDAFYSRLELYTLAANLTYFPSLEKLYFHCEIYYIPNNKFKLLEDVNENTHKVFEDMECVFPRLRNVIITSFLGETQVMKFIGFVMKSSPILESIVIYYHKVMDINQKIIFSTEIKSYNRASPTLQLYFLNSIRSKCYAHDYIYGE